MSLLQNSNAISSGGYNIANSLRFQSASSQFLSRTPASASNRKTWTWSGWVKRGSLSDGWLFAAGTSGVEYSGIILNATSNNILQFNCITASTNRIVCTTTAVLRDPSSWYHIIIAVDTTQATNSNGVKMYINGTQQTLSFTAYTQNVDTAINNNIVQNIGSVLSTQYFDGYMTEVNFIDGQALTPSSFGETNTLTGQWVAKKYTGTYGTNGFYLPFSNGTSTTTLGADSSGNSNNWTLTNFTRSAGVSDCWMYDVPSGNGGVSATQPSSNYAVMNPLKRYTSNMATTNANLTASDGSTASTTAVTTMSTGTSGKYYFECTMTAVASSSVGSGSNFVGVTNEGNVNGNGVFLGTGAYRSGNPIYNLAGTAQTAGSSYTAGDVIGVAVDVTAGTVQFYKNNVAQGATPSFTFTAGTELWAFVGTDNVAGTKTYNLNFGQRSFAYTPPSGFKALCTANLPASTIVKGNQYMDATLYTGTGANQTIVNAAGFSPDIVWGKSRSTADFHVIANTVVGANKYLFTNSTSTEGSLTDVITSFNSNGFTLGANQTINVNGAASVAWQWDAGSSTVTNTSGTISSQVRANPTAGVSVVTYTGTGANATVGHGLGVAPKMVITKNRNGADNWCVYHASLSSVTNILLLNTTNAQFASTQYTATPTSTILNLGSGSATNNSGFNFVAYCFAEIAGFSKIGSYTGNGSADGTFVYTGFRPKFVMIKATAGVENWVLHDTSRSTSNLASERLYPNLANAEDVGTHGIDILSNGFKVRTSLSTWNANAVSYIYMAFAESPFQNSNSR